MTIRSKLDCGDSSTVGKSCPYCGTLCVPEDLHKGLVCAISYVPGNIKLDVVRKFNHYLHAIWRQVHAGDMTLPSKHHVSQLSASHEIPIAQTVVHTKYQSMKVIRM